MRRREFLITFGSVIAWCTKAHPQRRATRLVGILEDSPAVSSVADEMVRIFKEKLRDYGWVEGQAIRFERRKAGTDGEQGRREAAALIELKPDVLVSTGTVVTAALVERTSNIGTMPSRPRCAHLSAGSDLGAALPPLEAQPEFIAPPMVPPGSPPRE